MKRRDYFPSFLNVEGRPCLIVGNDGEAFDKASRLIGSGAKVTLIAPSFEVRFKVLEATFIERDFRIDDVAGQFFVVWCYKESPQTPAVAKACREQKILLCAIDQPDYCDIINASIYERGDLKIAISTNGIAPALGKKIRKGLEESLGDVPLEDFLETLATLREKLEGEPDPKVRREKLIKAVESVRFRAEISLPDKVE